MSRGYVYILTNEAMPGLVKIGMTTRSVEQRVHELNTTGIPFPFDIYDSFVCPKCDEVEQEVHKALAECRVNDGREFFLCDPDFARNVVLGFQKDQVELWLDWFLPDHHPVEADAIVDINYILAKDGFEDVFWADLPSILEEATADELRPAMDRMLDRRARFKQEREEKT